MTDKEESINLRAHGRGGQGVVTIVEMIGVAELYEDKFCRSFPIYGSERRGAPLVAFATIGTEDNITRSEIEEVQHLVVLDRELPKSTDLTYGLKEGGTITFNWGEDIDEAYEIFDEPDVSKFATVDAIKIARKNLGRAITNTCLLGAFAKVTGLLELESAGKAIKKRFKGDIADKNIASAKEGFEEVEIKEFK